MKTSLIIGIVTSLVIGGSVGYFSGKSTNDNGAKTKELQDSITMMNEQSTNIQKMAEMMKSSGVAMQEMGVKYKDDEVISKGKDLETIGEKYRISGNSGSMKHVMGN